MEPKTYYPKAQRHKLSGILCLVMGLLVAAISFLADEGDLFETIFIASVGLLFVGLGVFFLWQGTSPNPVLQLTDEGIYFRQFPRFKAMFASWDNIWAVNMTNGFNGDIVVVLLRNADGVMAGAQGFSQRNHAKNARKMYGSPIAIHSGNLQVGAMPVFSEIYNRIEARKAGSA